MDTRQALTRAIAPSPIELLFKAQLQIPVYMAEQAACPDNSLGSSHTGWQCPLAPGRDRRAMPTLACASCCLTKLSADTRSLAMRVSHRSLISVLMVSAFGMLSDALKIETEVKIQRHSASLLGTGKNGCFKQQHRGRTAQQLALCALPEDTSSTDGIHQATHNCYTKGYNAS